MIQYAASVNLLKILENQRLPAGEITISCHQAVLVPYVLMGIKRWMLPAIL